MSDEVNDGHQIEIQYVGKLEDGSIFDSTEGKPPFGFTAGTPDVIEGINEAVKGMKVGEKKEVRIEPEKAYGQINEELMIKLERKQVPDEIEVGDALSDGTENNQPWFVREVTDEFCILDGNHPLAGKVLIFEIELVTHTP